MIYGIIFGTIGFSIILAVSTIWYFFNSSFEEFAIHGFRVYNYDADKGLIKEFVQPLNRSWINKSRFYRKMFPVIRDWTSVSYFSEFLKESEGEKILRQAVHDITKNPDNLRAQFTSNLPGFKAKVFSINKFNVFLNFQKIEDKNYIMEFKWTMVTEQDKLKADHIKQIHREELSNSKAGATAYLAFNVNDTQFARSVFLKLVASVWKEPLIYFLEGSLLVFVFQKSSLSRTQHELSRFIYRIKRTGFQLRARQLYVGSAFVNSNNAHLPKNQASALQVLEYLISASIERKTDFVSIENFKVDINNYKSYYEGLKVFRNAIKEKTFNVEMVPVKKFPENKPFMDIVLPSVKALNKNLFAKITSNYNYHSQLTDALADKVALDKDIKKVFLDVSLDWITANYSNLRNKNIIYIISVGAFDSQDSLSNVIQHLKSGGFEYGFRISYYDDEVGNKIAEFTPRFMIVDHSLVGEDGLFSSYEFISLLALADYAESKNSSLIYQKLPNYVNESIAKRIAIKYYY